MVRRLRSQQSSRSVKSDEGLEVGQLACESPVIMVRRIERFLGRVSARRLAAGDGMKSDGGNTTPKLPALFPQRIFCVALVLKALLAKKDEAQPIKSVFLVAGPNQIILWGHSSFCCCLPIRCLKREFLLAELQPWFDLLIKD